MVPINEINISSKILVIVPMNEIISHNFSYSTNTFILMEGDHNKGSHEGGNKIDVIT